MTSYMMLQRMGEIEVALSRLSDTIRECSQPQVVEEGSQAELFALAEKVFLATLPEYGNDTVAVERRAGAAFKIARAFLAERDRQKGAA